MDKLKSLLRVVSPHPRPLPTRGRGAHTGSGKTPSPLVGEGRGGGTAARGLRTSAPFTRRPVLHRTLRHGRHGADRPGGPGVVVSLRHPVSIATVMARKGQAQSLSDAMGKHFGLACPAPGQSEINGDLALHWCGFEQWYAVSDSFADGALYEALRERLSGLASISDQSHGRVILHIEGPRARDVLAKGTALDLHPRAFGPGRSAVTQMAHVGIHIAQVGPEAFELSLFRSFAISFWEWLGEMSDEYGYEVR